MRVKFTELEEKITLLLKEGYTPNEVAVELGISVDAVYVHLSKMRKKYVKSVEFVKDYEGKAKHIKQLRVKGTSF